MPAKLKKDQLVETMWAEMKPDYYGGPTGEEIIPGWSTYGEGDKEGTDGEPEVTLAAWVFPPGTRIVISEPICPDCEMPRIPKRIPEERKPLFVGPCECGFDWDAWAANRYS